MRRLVERIILIGGPLDGEEIISSQPIELEKWLKDETGMIVVNEERYFYQRWSQADQKMWFEHESVYSPGVNQVPLLNKYTTTCSCGVSVDVLQDQDDDERFHYECHNCGKSVSMTKIKERRT